MQFPPIQEQTGKILERWTLHCCF